MLKANKRYIYFQLFFLALFFLSGCKRETIIVPASSYNYFPVDEGRWVEYIVDSIYHSENDNENDDSVYSYHFEIREEIDSSFTDAAGQTAQVVKRFRRLDSLSAWTISNVWTQRLNSTSAYRTEDNISYHKLSFPINSSITWNGNDANILDEEIYYYDYFHEEEMINSLNFDSVISVIQVDEDNYIERIYGNEIYAAGVGLVYKVRNDLGKKNGIVVKGLEYKMEVKNYGKH